MIAEYVVIASVCALAMSFLAIIHFCWLRDASLDGTAPKPCVTTDDGVVAADAFATAPGTCNRPSKQWEPRGCEQAKEPQSLAVIKERRKLFTA